MPNNTHEFTTEDVEYLRHGDARLTASSPQWLREAHSEQLRYVRGPGS